MSFTASVSTVDHDGRFETVEENTAWTMQFPSGALASCCDDVWREYAGVLSRVWIEGVAGGWVVWL